MTFVHNCVLSMVIETLLFEPINSISNKDLVPDDKCPICLKHLSEMSNFGCCGRYSKKLKKCPHWVHVSCQINNNVNCRHFCSICKKILINKNDLDNGIKKYKI